LLLLSCGFHPRGALSLPQGAENIYLSGVAPSQPLARDIALLYTQGGGTVVDERDDAEAVLEILGESSDRRVAAVNADGRVSQFELYYAIRFRLLDLRGEIIHPESSVGVTRDYAFDPTNVLGKAQEEGLLRDDMRQQAVGQMLRRLARGTHLQKADDKPDASAP
jgi:LPS-assembly lipoprotein